MALNPNVRLISKILVIGAVIAALGYLFHPETGQLSVMINGHPVAEPLVRIAAIPTVLVIMALSVFLTLLLFLGIGAFMFLGALVIAMMACIVLAPYFWPVLVIIFLLIAVMSVSHEK